MQFGLFTTLLPLLAVLSSLPGVVVADDGLTQEKSGNPIGDQVQTDNTLDQPPHHRVPRDSQLQWQRGDRGEVSDGSSHPQHPLVPSRRVHQSPPRADDHQQQPEPRVGSVVAQPSSAPLAVGGRRHAEIPEVPRRSHEFETGSSLPADARVWRVGPLHTDDTVTITGHAHEKASRFVVNLNAGSPVQSATSGSSPLQLAFHWYADCKVFGWWWCSPVLVTNTYLGRRRWKKETRFTLPPTMRQGQDFTIELTARAFEWDIDIGKWHNTTPHEAPYSDVEFLEVEGDADVYSVKWDKPWHPWEHAPVPAPAAPYSPPAVVEDSEEEEGCEPEDDEDEEEEDEEYNPNMTATCEDDSAFNEFEPHFFYRKGPGRDYKAPEKDRMCNAARNLPPIIPDEDEPSYTIPGINRFVGPKEFNCKTGTCYSLITSWQNSIILTALLGKVTKTSAQQLVDCCCLMNSRYHNNGTNGGCAIYSFHCLMDRGRICYARGYEYDEDSKKECIDDRCSVVEGVKLRRDPGTDTVGCRQIHPQSSPTLIKRYLLAGIPISAEINAAEDMQADHYGRNRKGAKCKRKGKGRTTHRANETPRPYEGTCTSDPLKLDHMVLIVGWAVLRNSKGVEVLCWQMLNTWGSEAGYDGFIYIPVAGNACGYTYWMTYPEWVKQ